MPSPLKEAFPNLQTKSSHAPRRPVLNFGKTASSDFHKASSNRQSEQAASRMQSRFNVSQRKSQISFGKETVDIGL